MSQLDLSIPNEPASQPESIGKKIARMRQSSGWTQQALSERLAISRVAVSHIEMDLTIPSERTITLLAGLFKVSPHQLVSETTYPEAKTERLPLVACCYTALEFDLALLENDIEWLDVLRKTSLRERQVFQQKIQEKWGPRLEDWQVACFDEGEGEKVAAARKKLAAACSNKE
jgi:transcriptional regulator with XRE-family HTH domain